MADVKELKLLNLSSSLNVETLTWKLRAYRSCPSYNYKWYMFQWKKKHSEEEFFRLRKLIMKVRNQISEADWFLVFLWYCCLCFLLALLQIWATLSLVPLISMEIEIFKIRSLFSSFQILDICLNSQSSSFWSWFHT